MKAPDPEIDPPGSFERQVLAERLRERLAATEIDLRHQREPLTADFAEQAGERENEDVLESIRATTEGELVRVRFALERLEAGTYGVCVRCGCSIEDARLLALPDAECCAVCARSLAGARGRSDPHSADHAEDGTARE